MDYIDAKSLNVNTGQIKIHNDEDFSAMRKVGQMAASCLDMIGENLKIGMSTNEIDRMAHEFITSNNAFPAPLHYHGFPKSICTSLNHVICHGIPGDRILKNGDIINIDVTLIYDGWHGDHSRMFALGNVSTKAKKLMSSTYEALMAGIEIVRPGTTLGDIGAIIEAKAQENRFSIVQEFCGHGLGRVFHDTPNVMHYGIPGQGIVLREGMFFTIEPMLNAGKPDMKILSDGWTAVTRDRSLSAQYEHSIGVTKNGYEIFTLSPSHNHQPHLTPIMQ